MIDSYKLEIKNCNNQSFIFTVQIFWERHKNLKKSPNLTLLKLRHYEKASKFEKIYHLFWLNSCSYSVVSKRVGDFFKFLWPFQKNWTLSNFIHISWYFFSNFVAFSQYTYVFCLPKKSEDRNISAFSSSFHVGSLELGFIFSRITSG